MIPDRGDFSVAEIDFEDEARVAHFSIRAGVDVVDFDRRLQFADTVPVFRRTRDVKQVLVGGE